MEAFNIMRTVILLLSFSFVVLAQSDRHDFCDPRTPASSHCFTLLAPATIASDFSATLPATNDFGSMMQTGAGTWTWGGFGPATVFPNIATGSGVKVFVNHLTDDGSGAVLQVAGVTTGQGFFSQVTGGSWQGFNSNTDGALLRGFGLAANSANTAGGYFDFAPIVDGSSHTYSPAPGYACWDVYGNAVNQPVPLNGLSAFGVDDVLEWNSSSPLQGYRAPFTFVSPSNYYATGTPCATRIAVPYGAPYGINTNSYYFAGQGFASDNTAFNTFQAFSGGMQALTFTAAGLYPAGTQLRSGFTPNVYDTRTVVDSSYRVNNQYGVYLGGYIYTGFSDQDPSVGTIATVDNPIIGSTLFPGMMSYNTVRGCEVVYSGTTWGCIGSGGYWTLASIHLAPTSATYDVTLGGTSQASAIQVWGAASTTAVYQVNQTGGVLTPFQVDGYGDVSSGGSINATGNSALSLYPYRVGGTGIIDSGRNGYLVDLTLGAISSAGILQLYGANSTANVIQLSQTGGSNPIEFQVDGQGDVTAQGNQITAGYIDAGTWFGLHPTASAPATTPGSGYSALSYKSGSTFWYYNTTIPGWATADLAGGGYWTVSSTHLTPSSTTYDVTLGDTSQASAIKAWGAASTTAVFQVNQTGGILTPFQVDGYGDISSGGSINATGNSTLSLYPYRVGGTGIIDSNRNGYLIDLTLGTTGSVGIMQLYGANSTANVIQLSQTTSGNPIEFQMDGQGDITAQGNLINVGYVTTETWLGLPPTSSAPSTAPGSSYGALTYKGGSTYWYYNATTPGWAQVDFSAIGGQWTLSGSSLYPNATATNVLVGETSNVSGAKFEVAGTINAAGLIQSSATSGACIAFQTSTPNNFQADCNGNISAAGQFHNVGIAALGASAPTSTAMLLIEPAASSAQRGFYITQSFHGSNGIQNENVIVATSDDSYCASGTSCFSQLLQLNHTFGGAAMTGGRNILEVDGYFSGGATSASNTNRNYVAAQFQMFASNGDGGTGITLATAKGAPFGLSTVCEALSGATNLLGCTAADIEWGIDSGASAAIASGISIGTRQNHAVHGSLVDADIEFVSGGAAPNYLMYLDDLHGSPAVGTNTTILGTDGSTDTIAGGIDLSSYTITGYFLRSAHFSVDGSGTVISGSVLPRANDTYDLGYTSPYEWNAVYTKDLHVTGTCTGCGGGYWTLSSTHLIPSSATYDVTVGSTGQASAIAIWGAASSAAVLQVNQTGGVLTPLQVDGYGDISSSGSVSATGNSALSLAPYRVNGTAIVDASRNATFVGINTSATITGNTTSVDFLALVHSGPTTVFKVDSNGNMFSGSINPIANDTYDLGYTSPYEWNAVYTKDLHVTGTCTGCGTGNWTLSGALLYPNSTSDQVLVKRTTDDGSGAALEVNGSTNISGTFQSTVTGTTIAFQTANSNVQMNGNGLMSLASELHINNGGTGSVYMGATEWQPQTTGIVALGDSSKQFNGFYSVGFEVSSVGQTGIDPTTGTGAAALTVGNGNALGYGIVETTSLGSQFATLSVTGRTYIGGNTADDGTGSHFQQKINTGTGGVFSGTVANYYATGNTGAVSGTLLNSSGGTLPAGQYLVSIYVSGTIVSGTVATAFTWEDERGNSSTQTFTLLGTGTLYTPFLLPARLDGSHNPSFSTTVTGSANYDISINLLKTM
jgi:hypothetical protein